MCHYCRWRHCSYHCLQILAARALLFMVEGAAVQMQLAQDQQLRILAAALDSTHDPVSVPSETLSNKTPDQHSLELSVYRYTAASIS